MIDTDVSVALPPETLPARDLSANDFTQSGVVALEWIARGLSDPRRHPVRPSVVPGELSELLPRSAPLLGESMDAILEDFERLVVPRVTQWNHPNFHAYFAISSSGPGILGELLTAALDVNAMLWQSCPAATELEQVTAGWLLEWLGLPRDWFGMIVDSASIGVFQALVAARATASESSGEADGVPDPRFTVYVSEHTHSSVEKAAIAAGIARRHIRRLPVDGHYRFDAGALERAIEQDLARGLRPLFVAATVGTTSTTAIDPVPAIADLSERHGLWLHVDGAYGANYAVHPDGSAFLAGVERADSFVVNPHKLLLVPLDCSLLYTRHPERLRRAFALEAEYLKTGVSGVVDFMDYGLALGRRFRALKLWFVMRYFGRQGIVAHLDKSLRLTRWFGERAAEDPRFEIVAPIAMGLVCLRLSEAAGGDAATRRLLESIHATRRFALSHTVLGGRFVLRVAISNHRTELDDVSALWEALSAAAGVEAGASNASGD
jgi:aromatic-L-amino-acid decarboxylase